MCYNKDTEREVDIMNEKMFIVTAVMVRNIEAPDEETAKRIFEDIMDADAHDEFFADYDLQVEAYEE